jgi:NADH-quinone oxidoreductase subunit L
MVTTIELTTGFVLFLPLASFALCLLVSERYGWAVSILAPVVLLISALASTYLFFTLSPSTPILIERSWFSMGSYSLTANLELNRLTQVMMPVVTIISFLVHLYSAGYMAGDKDIRRYFAMLGFFTFAMLGVVLANDLLILFVFWELVGFSSYMLIGHWYEKPEAAQAAKKAFLFNRIGDVGFLIGLLIIWTNTHTLNLTNLLQQNEVYSWQTAASLCIFMGVIGKSAQLPLFTWLPTAMEGPTPVSALIHAATMVAAGVFLLAKVEVLFTPTALNVVTLVGITTALLAALSALQQYDIKKILAYSTISQLGLMVTAVGVGSSPAAMLHLFTHAFFKAGLFLAAGSIFHALHHAHANFDVQDIRNLGGLKKKLPFTFSAFTITASSLAGIPFFTGFISKDSILTAVWLWTPSWLSWQGIILIVTFLIVFITVLYTFRMVWFIFFSKETHPYVHVQEPPVVMRFPLAILAVASLWLMLSWNPFSASGWFTIMVGVVRHANIVTLLSVGVVGVALGVAWFYYSRKSVINPPAMIIRHTFDLDMLYQKVFINPMIRLASVAAVADRKWIDGVLHVTAYAQVSLAHVVAWFDTTIVDGSVNGLARLAGVVGLVTRSFQGGKIQRYIFWALLGLIIFLFFILI